MPLTAADDRPGAAVAKKPLRLVRVVWEDAGAVDVGPWVQRADLPAVTPVHFDQVGWLLELTAEHVVLSACVGEDLMGPRDRIPLGMVRSIHEFAEGDGRRVPLPRKRRKPAP